MAKSGEGGRSGNVILCENHAWVLSFKMEYELKMVL